MHYDNYNLHCVISIHALLAESDLTVLLILLIRKPISIHALLAESDLDNIEITQAKRISIHALLAESDSRTETIATKISDFYPRSPCGERQLTV